MSIKLNIFIVGALLGASLSIFAQAGFLDPSFGGTGMTQVGFGGFSEYGQVTAAQSDGRLLVAGYSEYYSGFSEQFLVMRLGTDNVPDPTFGAAGVAGVTAPYPPHSVGAMVQQADGKIVLGAAEVVPGSDGSVPAILLMRLNTNGSLDMSFGNNGFTSWQYNGYPTVCNGMALQPDGKIVVVGTSSLLSSFQDLSYMDVVRFDTNGNSDFSFGSGGSFVGTNYSSGNAVALRGDGDILVGGYTAAIGAGVFAFTTNGVIDTGFGSGGATAISAAYGINALAIVPAGIVVGQTEKIIAAGSASLNLVVARMSTSGALDTSFGGTGYITRQISPTAPPTVVGMTIYFTGSIFAHIAKIVVGGYLNNTGFMAATFNADGSSNTNFGSSGIVVTPIPGANSATAYGLTPVSGDLVISGGEYGFAPCSENFVVARYHLLNGALDTSFYGSGILVTNFGNLNSEANSVAMQGDGKIVVAGYCEAGCNSTVLALCRLNPDSTLDASFGAGGKVITGIGPESSRATPMAIQPDGRIVVAGVAATSQYNSVMVARFLTNGVLDASFGSGGIVTNQVGTNASSPNAMALQRDGKILVGASGQSGVNDIAILRLTTNGSPDLTWNTTGQVFTVIGTSDSMTALAVQPDGKVVDGGFSSFSSAAEFSMIRCKTNGSLDSSFGSFGRVADPISGQVASGGYAMALQPDGKILLAGVTINSSSQQQIAMMRFNTNGSVDTTFGTNGATIASIGLGGGAAFSVALQSDGKIVTGCITQVGPANKFAAARFLTNGILDSAYGIGGVNYFDFGTGANENLNGMALDSLQRMVLVGTAGNLFAVARVSGDPLLRFSSISELPNQNVLLTGLGVPGVSQTLLEATNPVATFSPLATIMPDASGYWQFVDTNAVGSHEGIYRLSYP